MAIAILRLPAVKARVGLGRTSINDRVAEGTFPRPVRLGQRAVGWVEAEIEKWLEDCINSSRRSKARTSAPVANQPPAPGKAPPPLSLDTLPQASVGSNVSDCASTTPTPAAKARWPRRSRSAS